MTNENRHGNWIQRAWWWIRDLFHQFKPCRFSVIVAIIGGLVFLVVEQGKEILRTVGEGMAGGQWYWPRVCGFFGALILWALSSWYASRVLLYLKFPGASAEPRSKLFEKHVPRLLGIAPLLIVGWGFLVAAGSYAPAVATAHWMRCFAALCAVLAIMLYVMFALRRRFIGETSQKPVARMSQLPRSTIVAASTMMLVSLLLFIGFAAAPIRIPQWLGMGTILFLAAASWVSIGSYLVYLAGRWRLPVIGFFIALALVFSLWNDNHVIRTAPAEEVNRADVIQSFRAWYGQAEKNDGAGVLHPLFIVATEGGGIRAAYWTAAVLGEIQDENPAFASHLFAVSGVSGGSLGAAVFEALLAEPDAASFKFKDKAHDILSQDFLSPTLAAMFYPDLVQRFLPVPIPYFDRGRALELAWEKAWRDTMHNNRFAESFVDLWKPGPREWMPALFLNGTSVEKGNRIITSNLRLTSVFLDAEDAADKLAEHGLPATKAGCHIPLSTAAHMSARFTFVSPAGRFPGGSHIVDGGYFENSAATAALEMAVRIKDDCTFEGISNVDVKVIMISNDPRKPSIMIAPAKPGPEPPGPKRSKPSTFQGQFLGETTAPLYALLNTRTARGTYAQKAIAREQRRVKAGVISAPGETEQAQPETKDIVYFGLRDRNVPLPLGWMLSAEAAKTMQEQLRLNDDVVHNGAAMDEVLRTLPVPLVKATP
jgi:Patatin-like phospholipase